MKNFKKWFLLRNSKGFTLIELLVVIAIIGILSTVVIVSLTASKTKANAAATKKTLDSLRTPITLCCDKTTNTLLNIAGGEVCSPAVGANLPTKTQLKLSSSGNVVYTGGSCTIPAISVAITGHAKTACNGTWTVNVNSGVTAPAGC